MQRPNWTVWISMWKSKLPAPSSSCADLCSIHVQLQPVCITELMHSAFDVIQLDKCVGRVPQRGPIFLCPKFQTLRCGMSLVGCKGRTATMWSSMWNSQVVYFFIIEVLMRGPVFWSRNIINYLNTCQSLTMQSPTHQLPTNVTTTLHMIFSVI